MGSEMRVLRQHPSGGHAHLSPGREGTGRVRPGRAPVLEPWPYDRGGETDPGGLFRIAVRDSRRGAAGAALREGRPPSATYAVRFRGGAGWVRGREKIMDVLFVFV